MTARAAGMPVQAKNTHKGRQLCQPGLPVCRSLLKTRIRGVNAIQVSAVVSVFSPGHLRRN